MIQEEWEEIVGIIEELLDKVDDVSKELCEKRYFKACIVISEKVVPALEGLLYESRTRAEIRELAEEEEERELEPLIGEEE